MARVGCQYAEPEQEGPLNFIVAINSAGLNQTNNIAILKNHILQFDLLRELKKQERSRPKGVYFAI